MIRENWFEIVVVLLVAAACILIMTVGWKLDRIEVTLRRNQEYSIEVIRQISGEREAQRVVEEVERAEAERKQEKGQ